MPRCVAMAVFLSLVLACSARTEGGDVDFVRDVVPALTKAGCSAGACHGSFQGRGSFKLSLLGFDPQADYQAIVHDARGRRVIPSAPDESLILRKPTQRMPHGGGLRLTSTDPTYAAVRHWIADGMPPPRADLHVTRLEVSPTELVMQPGQQHSLTVRSTWSDGQERDVTSWAQYEVKEESIATASPAGAVTAVSSGRMAVMVRYMGVVAAVPVTVPFASSGEASSFVAQGFVDELVAAEWKKLALSPVALSTDEEFVRRVYLDLIGTLPTPDEVRGFLADASGNKRAMLMDALLERPEYVDYWALKWSDLLRAHRRSLGEKGMASFSSWLKQRLRENAPIDQIARELISAEGNLYTSGPVAFYFVDKTPEELAETTAQIFCGIRLTCARCHHHPFEVWGQEDYYSLASFFTGVSRKDNKEQGMFGGAQGIKVAAAAPLKHPRSGAELPPRAFGWQPAAANSADVRRSLADWLTSADNPRFARTVVNRYWGYLLGRGLVHPIDDLSTSNPPVFPSVLDSLTADFVAHKYDLKHLLRTIARSRVYQLAGDIEPAIDAEGKYFTRRIPFRLPAEVLLDAVNQAAGTIESFANLPEGMRAITLPDSSVDSYFLTTFGRPRRTSTCECDRMSRLDLSQVLHLANGEAIHGKVTAAGGRVARLLEAKSDDATVIEQFYLATLSRMPTMGERDIAGRFIASAPSRKEAVEDLLWTLLNCSEFVMNH
ncbi:MAG TPA: DUF1549 domain-containing protein [Pirellulaceae bacterium]|nr:DUF1549 domain-containing protein [Pirellulaceae bacterium]